MKINKFYSLAVFITVFAFVAAPSAHFVFAQEPTISELEAQIKSLKAQLEQLKDSINKGPGSVNSGSGSMNSGPGSMTQGSSKPMLVSVSNPAVSGGSFCHEFNANMSRHGALSSTDITALNAILAKEGLTQLEAKPVFSEEAVKKFQEKYADEILKPVGLEAPTGIVGAATRSKLNAAYGCSSKPIFKPTTKPILEDSASNKYGLKITYPNGGETLELGRAYTATFDANIPLTSKMLVYLGREYDKSSFKYKPGAFNSTALLGCLGYKDGVGFEQGGCGVPTNVWGSVGDKSFKFVIPSYMSWMGLGGGYRLMVCDEACSESAMKDISDNSFTIVAAGSNVSNSSVSQPTLTLDTPTISPASGTLVPASLPSVGIDADITNDGVVNVNDLLAVINTWGPCASAPTCTADINIDKMVNGMDLDLVIKYWTK